MLIRGSSLSARVFYPSAFLIYFQFIILLYIFFSFLLLFSILFCCLFKNSGFCPPVSIHNWIKDAKSVEFDDRTEVTSKEFKQLQKENQCFKEELEILKARKNERVVRESLEKFDTITKDIMYELYTR